MMTNPTTPPTFEAALQTLQLIVHELEEGQVDLATSLARYEQGVKLLRQCYELLSTAERKIELLSGATAAGAPITEPFEEQAETLPEKAQSRGKRRSRPTKPAEPAVSEIDDESDGSEPKGLF